MIQIKYETGWQTKQHTVGQRWWDDVNSKLNLEGFFFYNYMDLTNILHDGQKNKRMMVQTWKMTQEWGIGKWSGSSSLDWVIR